MTAGASIHFCPGCGTPQTLFARYPWYFCNACLDSAADCDGRKLAFGNASFSGGLTWGYADDPTLMDNTALEVICLIRERPVAVGEARFGGVVAQPVNSNSIDTRKFGGATINLTEAFAVEAAKKRLKRI